VWYNVVCTLLKFMPHVEVFDQYLRAHVEQFKYKTITTDDWKKFFLSYFHKQVCNHLIMQRIFNVTL